jgi:hypothetical protein
MIPSALRTVARTSDRAPQKSAVSEISLGTDHVLVRRRTLTPDMQEVNTG